MTLSTTQRHNARTFLAFRDGATCAHPGCNATDELEVDHIVSQANGGNDELANLQLLCRTHNAGKLTGATIHGTSDANTEYVREVRNEGKALYSRIHSELRRHVYHSDEWVYTALALTVIALQHPFREVARYLPIIAISSPKPGMGKTTLMDVLTALLPQATRYASLQNHTALVRLGGSTYVLDEANGMEPWRGGFRSYLNESHKYGAVFPIQEPTPEGAWAARNYSAFTGFVIGSLRLRLADDTRSRCIWVDMSPKPNGLRLTDLDNDIIAKLETLGNEIEAWAGKAAPLIPKQATPGFVKDRNADVWGLMFRVAGFIGFKAHADAWQAAHEYISGADERQARSEIDILAEDLATLLRDGEDLSVDGFMPTVNLIHALQGCFPDAWGNLSGKPLDAKRLGRMLADLGCGQSVQRRINGKPMRGYTVASIKAAISQVADDDTQGGAHASPDIWTFAMQTLSRSKSGATPEFRETASERK